MENKSTKQPSVLYQQFIGRNPLLVSAVLTAPVIYYMTTLGKTAEYCLVFSAVTIITMIITSFIPRSVPYASRIIFYTLTAAAVYIPVAYLCDRFMPGVIAELGIFAPLTVINPFIVFRSEAVFFRINGRAKMILCVVFAVLSFDITAFLFSFVREIVTTSGVTASSAAFPVFAYPCGGCILLGFCMAVFRQISERNKD